MAAPTIYKSTDGSAPTLSGTAGDLVNLLDKCLVAGYGAKAAAGWTKPYVGTNKASFRQGAGNQFYLRVVDDASGAGTGKEAKTVGYETMSDVDNGTGLFPTAVQLATGITVRKSLTADATTRAWILIADDRTFYLFVLTADIGNTYYAFGFGDIFSLLTGDGYKTVIIGRNAENSSAVAQEYLAVVSTGIGTQPGHYMARGYTALGGSVAVGRHTDNAKGSSSGYLLGTIAYPNPVDGGLWLAPFYVHDAVTAPAPNIRGRMRGLYCQLHTVANFTDGDTFSGVGDYAGRTFLLLKNAANAGIYCIETTAWDTSS